MKKGAARYIAGLDRPVRDDSQIANNHWLFAFRSVGTFRGISTILIKNQRLPNSKQIFLKKNIKNFPNQLQGLKLIHKLIEPNTISFCNYANI